MDRALVNAGGIEDLHSLVDGIRHVNRAGRTDRHACRIIELGIAGTVAAPGIEERDLSLAGGGNQIGHRRDGHD